MEFKSAKTLLPKDIEETFYIGKEEISLIESFSNGNRLRRFLLHLRVGIYGAYKSEKQEYLKNLSDHFDDYLFQTIILPDANIPFGTINSKLVDLKNMRYVDF